MDPADALEQLIQAGIVEESIEDEGLELSESYRTRLEERLSDLRNLSAAGLREAIAIQQDDDEAAQLLDLSEGTVEPIAQYLTLAEAVDGLEFEKRLRLVPTLQQLYRPAPDRGAPKSFTPVRPGQLPFLLNLYKRAIVYVWRDECPPCDTMVEEFDTFFSEPDDDLALLTVYGPADPQFLEERYNVRGGPTTLFVLDGEVDARLHGAQFSSVIESEIETLRTL